MMSSMPPDIGTQHEYYSNRWSQFENANRLDLARMAKVLEFMTAAELPPGARICDLGCGAGWSTSILGVFGQAIGVDLSDVGAAQARYPHCLFESANILEWQGPREAFDLVVSLEVIEHIERPLQHRYLQVAQSVLKPGGYLILTTPNARTMNAIPGGGRSWSDQPVEDWLSATELDALLRSNGFQVLGRTSIVLGIGRAGGYRIVNSPKLNHVLDRLRLGHAWRRLALAGNYGLHLVVLARKERNGV